MPDPRPYEDSFAPAMTLKDAPDPMHPEGEPVQKLPVLSLWRPWPTLILHHGKDVENRRWITRHRGDILLAGAARWDNQMRWPVHQPARHSRGLSRVQSEHPRGIVGVVEVHDICTRQLDDKPCDCGPWATTGYAHWKLRNPRPFPEPVPHTGRLKLHQVPDDNWPAVQKQLAAANDPELIDKCMGCDSVDIGVERHEQGQYLRCYSCGYNEKI